MEGMEDLRSTSNSEGTYESWRDHVFLLTFTSDIISVSCSNLSKFGVRTKDSRLGCMSPSDANLLLSTCCLVFSLVKRYCEYGLFTAAIDMKTLGR